MSRYTGVSRRNFLVNASAATGALVIGTSVPVIGRGTPAAAAGTVPEPNAFIRIGTDDTVTVLIKHLDKGQGIATGLTSIVAEELDASWSQMQAEFAPADVTKYANLALGVQGTGGSTSVANSYDQLRRAAAAARAMLVAAAAQEWQVPADEITVVDGKLSHQKSARSAPFGALASAAAKQPVPGNVVLKSPAAFKLIGPSNNGSVKRLDSVGKTTGATMFSLDVRRPGMLTAVVQRPPRFGATVASFDAARAKQVNGVVDVVQIPQGVAVVAQDTWSAMKGREALRVTWDESAAEKRSTDEIFNRYAELSKQPGAPAAKEGDAGKALAGAAEVIEAEFRFPYLAHAPMEPLNAVIERRQDGSVEVWAGAQLQTVEQATIAAVLGLKPEQVTINTIWAGGSFGRRATPNADYLAEAAEVLKATGGRAPIHLVWTREDDIQGGRYRPMFLHRIRAGLNDAGQLVGWEQRLVGQSFIIGSPFESFIVKDGIDGTAVEGSADMPYAVADRLVEWHHTRSPVTTLWWRSVGHTHSAHAVEVMIDELAWAAKKDPVAFRLAMLTNKPRHAGVLKLAAEKANWGSNLGAGRGRGVAVHESFGSFVAMVSEVSYDRGQLKVDRVVAAVDVGMPINPDIIRAQVEGAVGYALSAALRGNITLKEGLVEQTNFDAYEPIRINEMPRVEVHILSSEQAPSGIGEPGVPPLAPSLSNALFAATGQRLRSLPLDLKQLKS